MISKLCPFLDGGYQSQYEQDGHENQEYCYDPLPTKELTLT